MENDFLKIMSYNVLLDFEKEGREPDFTVELAASIKEQSPDIIGTQETVLRMHEECLSKLTEYICYKGEAYTDYNHRGNYVYWKTDKFKALEMGHRYMSDTPMVRSKYEKSREYRGFNYVLLESLKTGRHILFINLHADYRSDEDTRVLQLKTVTAFLKQSRWDNVPAIVVGDFNSTAEQACISTFLADNPHIGMTSANAEVKGDVGSTLVGGGFTRRIEPYIFDYIFVTKDIVSTRYYSAIDNVKNGKYPSDHLPVIAEIEICADVSKRRSDD